MTWHTGLLTVLDLKGNELATDSFEGLYDRVIVNGQFPFEVIRLAMRAVRAQRVAPGEAIFGRSLGVRLD